MTHGEKLPVYVLRPKAHQLYIGRKVIWFCLTLWNGEAA